MYRVFHLNNTNFMYTPKTDEFMIYYFVLFKKYYIIDFLFKIDTGKHIGFFFGIGNEAVPQTSINFICLSGTSKEVRNED